MKTKNENKIFKKIMIKIVRHKIPLDELRTLAKTPFSGFVKAVVDVERELMAIGGDLHADEETILLKDGSKQEHLWGINIYPEESAKKRIEFDSMINLRPSCGNLSRGIDDSKLQTKILKVTDKLIKE